jgi:hypothetical protein
MPKFSFSPVSNAYMGEGETTERARRSILASKRGAFEGEHAELDRNVRMYTARRYRGKHVHSGPASLELGTSMELSNVSRLRYFSPYPKSLNISSFRKAYIGLASRLNTVVIYRDKEERRFLIAFMLSANRSSDVALSPRQLSISLPCWFTEASKARRFDALCTRSVAVSGSIACWAMYCFDGRTLPW